MGAVLRVSGDRLDVDGCLAWIPKGRLERIWHVGERGRKGSLTTTSGFVLLLSDADETSRVVEEAMSTFLCVAPRVRDLVRAGANAEIDFELMVGPKGSRSLTFDPRLLRSLEGHEATIVVTAYPVSEDEGE